MEKKNTNIIIARTAIIAVAAVAILMNSVQSMKLVVRGVQKYLPLDADQAE